MTPVNRTVAWTIMCSTLFTGCYSSVLIDPAGEEGNSLRTGEIECVVGKDKRQYVFETPPTVVGDTIIGVAGGDSVSIPLADIYRVQVSQFDVPATVVVSLVAIGGVILIVTSKGPERTLDIPPLDIRWY
jgi:hypothetical protein